MSVKGRVCGTRSAYSAGCRCDPCRLANATYFRHRYEERRIQEEALGMRNDLPILAVEHGPWIEDAKCKGMDPDFFFPNGGKGMSEPERFCRGEDGSLPCKVRFECLDFALANRIEDGVFGGLKAEERIRMRRNRKRSA